MTELTITIDPWLYFKAPRLCTFGAGAVDVQTMTQEEGRGKGLHIVSVGSEFHNKECQTEFEELLALCVTDSMADDALSIKKLCAHDGVFYGFTGIETFRVWGNYLLDNDGQTLQAAYWPSHEPCPVPVAVPKEPVENAALNRRIASILINEIMPRCKAYGLTLNGVKP